MFFFASCFDIYIFKGAFFSEQVTFVHMSSLINELNYFILFYF